MQMDEANESVGMATSETGTSAFEAALENTLPDVEALLHENEELRAQVTFLEKALAEARASTRANDVSELGRSLLFYVLDVICALLEPQRGNIIVVDLIQEIIRSDTTDTQLVIGPMQMVLERPGIERAVSGNASRMMTRYESVLWLPIMHSAEAAVILCLRRGPNAPYSIQEQEIGELLGALVISALQTGKKLFELHEDPEALRNLSTALSPAIRAGGGRVAARETDAERLAEVFKLPKRERRSVQLGAILHDIGTVDLAEDVLHPTDALSKGDFEQVRLHPIFGAEIVRQLPGLEDVIPLVLHHHERWDGAGYPEGLVHEDTPLGARIIAVVDAFHSMVSPRAFQSPRSVEQALQALIDGAGSQFDPEVVEAFTHLARVV